MKPREFEDHLRRRASHAGLAIDSSLLAPLEAYFRLLAHWNRTINLTALRLDEPTDDTIDRLFIEPLAAAPFLVDLPGSQWLDAGSGGGSPAIPLALARADLRLTMVESRHRKAAFLREVVRTLELDAVVENARLEDLANARAGTVALVTGRGIKPDRSFFTRVEELLDRNGVLALFTAVTAVLEDPSGSFDRKLIHELIGNTRLAVYRVPRGT